MKSWVDTLSLKNINTELGEIVGRTGAPATPPEAWVVICRVCFSKGNVPTCIVRAI